VPDDAWLVMCRVSRGHGQALEAAGFRLIERLVVHERSVAPTAQPGMIRHYRPEDRARCLAIMPGAFATDRYHTDVRIPAERAEALKAAWVANNLDGRAQVNLVAEIDDRIVGFNLVLLRGRQAVIDLIAVDRAARGKGVGRALIDGALAMVAGQADTLRAGTQATNAGALALYRGMGFRQVDESLTYHWMRT
jgi:ribosomal protein S18 acetylase RimI-like enzyme